MRFELTTLTLARLCSTPELRPRPSVEAIYKTRGGAARGNRGKFPQHPETRKGRPMGDPFRLTDGAGEEIRTLDPNLGKVMLYP